MKRADYPLDIARKIDQLLKLVDDAWVLTYPGGLQSGGTLPPDELETAKTFGRWRAVAPHEVPAELKDVFDICNGRLIEVYQRPVAGALGASSSSRPIIRFKDKAAAREWLLLAKMEREQQAMEEEAAHGAKDGMTWQEAAERMERLRSQGEKFTSQGELAGRFGCSKATINKAIKSSPALTAWAERQTAPRAQSMNEVVTDRTAQAREIDPADDAAIREYVEQADPETKAWFLALPADQQMEVVNDPDKHPRVLGRKP